MRDASTEPLVLRAATREDANAVAQLHAESWRTHYRASLTTAYLDGPVYAERRATWALRLDHPRDGQFVILAESAGALVGFVCVFADHDRTYGALIDNLHVATASRGVGIGRHLLEAVGETLRHVLPLRPVYLFVIEGNHDARGFYLAMGGTITDEVRDTLVDGSQVTALRVEWPTPLALVGTGLR